jgi:hypothetical protein
VNLGRIASIEQSLEVVSNENLRAFMAPSLRVWGPAVVSPRRGMRGLRFRPLLVFFGLV